MDRLQLQTNLEELLGSRNVYYQPPENVKMNYPAIVYSKSNLKTTFANGNLYSKKTLYEIVVIDRRPDNPVIEKIMSLPYCKYGRHYITEGLYHDVLNLYL